MGLLDLILGYDCNLACDYCTCVGAPPGRALPAAEVLRVYRKWFVPDSMRIVVAGPASELRKTFPDGSPGLETYGPVRIWNPDSLRVK